jgi:hypothetical protein
MGGPEAGIQGEYGIGLALLVAFYYGDLISIERMA